jgi:beta-lactamase regulating signal transducer with metallopeptidase domain
MSIGVDWSALVVRLGFTLAHFLWEGAAIGILLRVLLAACRSSRARYTWSLSAMAAMAAAPIITFCLLGGAGAQVRATFVTLNVPDQSETSFAWTYAAVAVWAAGVSLLALRTGTEFLFVERLRRRADPLPKLWLQRCEALARRVSVRLREIAGPIVTGFVKPMILIPGAALTSMPVEQLEALILHELAHVRRLDAIANLVQTVVEILLFYHPAVWWVSRSIRQEREHCCDDIAVREIGDPADFVRALQSLADLQRRSLAMAATGGSLATRVRRLLAAQGSPKKTDVRAILLAVVPLAAGMLGYSIHACAHATANANVARGHAVVVNLASAEAHSVAAVIVRHGRLLSQSGFTAEPEEASTLNRQTEESKNPLYAIAAAATVAAPQPPAPGQIATIAATSPTADAVGQTPFDIFDKDGRHFAIAVTPVTAASATKNFNVTAKDGRHFMVAAPTSNFEIKDGDKLFTITGETK